MISYGRHNIDSEDIKNVIKALKSDYLTSGPRIKEFENKLNKKFGGKYCTVVNNGTSALHLLGKALNWKKNDLIATTPISFIATSKFFCALLFAISKLLKLKISQLKPSGK